MTDTNTLTIGDHPRFERPKSSNFRWWICGLLFLATTVNYVDRQVIGVLQTTLKHDLGWNDIDYSNVVFWFTLAYAASYAIAGRLMDLIGVKLGYGISILLWSIAAAAHALAHSVFGFGAARFGLGLAEGGNFPAAVKTVTEWFPRKQRALATGIFNAGSNVGAIVTPLIVPWITLKYGWRVAFLVTGALGFFVVVLWWLMYDEPRNHPRVSEEELAFIESDPPEPMTPVPWLSLLKFRAVWAYIIGGALTSPVWWFYLFWVPGFLYDKFHVDLKNIGPPLIVIYLISDFGSVFGGWLSSKLIHNGWSVNSARKTAILICVCLTVPVAFVSQTDSTWVATLLIALAAAGHQGWSANLYTFASDTMPRRAVSSVVGLGGLAGGIVGMGNAKFIGYLLQMTHSYTALFIMAPCAYIVALIAIQILVPVIAPVSLARADEDVQFAAPDA